MKETELLNLDANDKFLNDFLTVLNDFKLGEEKKTEGLAYYALKNGKVTLDDLNKNLPKTIEVVNILMRLDNINYSLLSEEAEKLRNMFFAITKDIRIIMLKIAFVVAELRNVDDKDEEYKHALANSILALFAPLSARLGLSYYKTELENGAFKLLNPQEYDRIQLEVDNRYHKRQPIVERLTALVEDCLKELNITGKVYGRKKHIYSIYKKLQNHNFDNIYDLIAVRAIVKTVPDCYALLGRIHSKVEPLQNRFKDYIAIPKSNGYQSLHTTVIFEGFPVEIQIRTEDMNNFAEYGVAAHWVYKEKRKQSPFDARIAEIRRLMEGDTPVEELADSLNRDIYDGEIIVQTPKGKVVYLPKGATPIDFAYAIHSEIGNKYVGAKINNKIVGQSATLHNGDVIEIITNPNSKGPSRDWLKICKTSTARNKINAFFKKNLKEENIHLGKTMLENAIKDKGFSSNKLLNKKSMEDLLAIYNFDEENELYANIGSGAISPKIIANKLAQQYESNVKTALNPKVNPQININEPKENQIKLPGMNNILIRFAKCCQPMYNDDIIGFISSGRGIIIHRSVCPNTSYFRPERLVEASWKPQPTLEKKAQFKQKSTK